MVSLRTNVRGVESGKRFGTREVLGQPFSLGRYGVRQNSIAWNVVVKCDCGRVDVVPCCNLAAGNAGTCRSCAMSKTMKRHGESGTRLFGIWAGMRQRCSNPNSTFFDRYGGRGISIYPEWDSYEAFRDWALANGYADDKEIDRIDNDGNYEPGNCRWTTRLVQSRNTSRAKLVTAFGETKCLSEWGDDSRCVVASNTLKRRIYAGWDAERAITEPSRGTGACIA